MPRAEHELLRRACELADSLGYERRAVWTFTRVGGPLYASIARELYLGCGAGAATFTGTDFLVNHFGLGPYEEALAGRSAPARAAGAPRSPAGGALLRLLAALRAGHRPRPLPRHLPRRAVGDSRSRRCFGEPATSSRSTAACASPSAASTATTTSSGGSPTTLIEPLWEDMLQEHPVRDRPRPRATAEPRVGDGSVPAAHRQRAARRSRPACRAPGRMLVDRLASRSAARR